MIIDNNQKEHSITDTENFQQTANAADTQEELFSLAQVCKLLSISQATGKNWLKLGKIQADRAPFFSAAYVNTLKKDIQSGINSALKSRRNKKYVSGNMIYKSYLSSRSANLEPVETLFGLLEGSRIDLTDQTMALLLAECAIQLICECEHYSFPQNENLLRLYVNNKLDLGSYSHLIDDLLEKTQDASDFVTANPLLFRLVYQYVEGEDILGLLYISLKDIRDRKATGSYYTPTAVVEKMMRGLFTEPIQENATAFDPCCGTGNFLLQLPCGFSFHQVYGNDLDLLSVRIARINLAMKYHIRDYDMLCSHITHLNYLTQADGLAMQQYHYILGNPPWGYDFSQEEAEQLRHRYHCAAGSKAIESFDVFIEQALSQLVPGGMLSFVLPEAVLNVKSHTKIRQLIMDCNSIRSLIFLGNAFDKVQCPCILLQVEHTQKPFSCIGMRVEDGDRSFTMAQERICYSDCFSFHMDDAEYRITRKMTDVPHITTLAGQADFALGIVTGNNSLYLTSEKNAQNEAILKGADLMKYKSREAGNFITFDPDSFQQCAKTEFYRAPEKLLYRFISDKLVFAYDDKQTLSLNSCNIVIPRVYDLSVRYILALLNSRPVQFYYNKMFRSVKVLRSYLEQLPLPIVSDEKQIEIVNYVEQLINDEPPENLEYSSTYQELDRKIASLYELTQEEYELILRSLK